MTELTRTERKRTHRLLFLAAMDIRFKGKITLMDALGSGAYMLLFPYLWQLQAQKVRDRIGDEIIEACESFLSEGFVEKDYESKCFRVTSEGRAAYAKLIDQHRL